jgi:hypothetical protein
MLNYRIRAREDHAFVSITPADDEWRFAMLAPHLKNQCLLIGFSNVVGSDQQDVSCLCMHQDSFLAIIVGISPMRC